MPSWNTEYYQLILNDTLLLEDWLIKLWLCFVAFMRVCLQTFGHCDAMILARHPCDNVLASLGEISILPVILFYFVVVVSPPPIFKSMV